MPNEEEDLSRLSPEQIEELQIKNCVFCQIAQNKIPTKKVYEDEKCIAVLDIGPANLGHMLLLPKQHYSVMPQLPDELTGHLFKVAKKLSQAALKVFRLKGTTIFVANGIAAGQKAPHVLIHIIPRAFDDGIDLSLPVSKADQRPLRDVLAKMLQSSKRDMPIMHRSMPEIKSMPEAQLPEGKIAKLGIKRQKGYLYFIDKEGDVAKAKMSRGGKKGMRKKKKVKVVYVPVTKKKIVYVARKKPKAAPKKKNIRAKPRKQKLTPQKQIAKVKANLDEISRLFR